MTRSQRQLMKCGKELGLSLEERRLLTPLKSSDLLSGKRVLVKLVSRKTKMGLEIEVTEGGKEEAWGLIEEAVASMRLAHLVKDIRQSGQKNKGSQPKEKRRLQTW
ncbi:hypothetical protein Tco_0187696 [Tanacetum coccineum]